MNANVAISVKIGTRSFRMRPGKPIPPQVLEFWKQTGQLEKLIACGSIGPMAEAKKPAKPAPKPQAAKKEVAHGGEEPSRASKSS